MKKTTVAAISSAKQDGYDKGYQDGYKDGYNLGSEEGYKAGYVQGIQNCREDITKLIDRSEKADKDAQDAVSVSAPQKC